MCNSVSHVAMKAAIAFGAVCSSLLTGCARTTAAPTNYYEVRLEATAKNQDDCSEEVSIEFAPVKVARAPVGSLYQSESYVDRPQIVGKPVLDGPNNWECHFTYRSRNLSPGTWRITGMFPSPVNADYPAISQTCEREVVPGRQGRVRLDQEEGCTEFDAPGTEMDRRNKAAP